MAHAEEREVLRESHVPVEAPIGERRLDPRDAPVAVTMPDVFGHQFLCARKAV